MSFLRKIFGGKTGEPGPAVGQPSKGKSGDNSDMIRVFDGYGREMLITRQQWRDDVLLPNLKKMKTDPEQLYNTLVTALQDGFVADIIPYAEHLARTDPTPSRGATILGITYMETNRLDEAQRVLESVIAAHGEDGVVLTNLAKVHSRRGDGVRAESILWHALEVDPNQDNGLGWYTAIHRERGGEAAELDAFRRVAALPGSWRAQLWLARDALHRKDLATAESLYAEALPRAGRPTPAGLLMQMSGDLGNAGYLSEIFRLVAPRFDASYHGLQVGNNLIKAYLDLGQREAARRVLNQLYAQKRPDWQRALSDWDTELAKAEVAKRAEPGPGELQVTLMSIEGPLWSRDGSPLATLLPAKRADAPQIAVLGSTAVLAEASDKPGIQLSDASGRLSRGIPLMLTEQIHLGTDARGTTLIPWMQGHGFALFGRPYPDAALCGFARQSEGRIDYLASIILDATQPLWRLDLCLLRIADARRLAEDQIEVVRENPGPAAEQLAERLCQLLAAHAGVRRVEIPDWHRIPSGEDLSDYLLRIEQQLAVACVHFDFLQGGWLSGERGILDGTVCLCLRQPKSPTVRLVLAQTVRQMQKARPEVVPEYREKIGLLQRDHPIPGEVGRLVDKVFSETFGDERPAPGNFVRH